MYIDYMQIGNRIKTKRKENRLTQENLAEILDVSVGYISQLERGVTKVSLDTLASIATVLKCDVTYFVAQSVVTEEGYRCGEFSEKFTKINGEQRSTIIDIIDVLIKHQAKL